MVYDECDCTQSPYFTSDDNGYTPTSATTFFFS